jgi:hypothetical protein
VIQEAADARESGHGIDNFIESGSVDLAPELERIVWRCDGWYADAHGSQR